MSELPRFDGAVLQSLLGGFSPSEREDVEPDAPVEWNLPGFLGKTRVGTAFGDLPIEALRVRDDIRTATGALVRVEWIDKLHLDEDFLTKHPSAQPIRIPANAFGQGRPMTEMTVSPCQMLSPDAHVASRFVSGRDLCAQSRAHRAQSTGLTYYRFHCGAPVTVRMEGVLVRV
ncbi:Hint domain-containing protein [Tabrizicola sp. BL-A-41-H6]|uniref:Hint domain-containing protein n=1 Tax=Tabrizicola sp. BL-A-41-H6 TaxID=3421107 RepID=UPI003D678485